MIEQIEMMQILEKYRGDAVVIPTMRANMGWAQVSTNVARDMPVSNAMGKGSSFALGLCLARPDTKVILFDGDGGLLMNMGSLVTIANRSPKNLYHFVIDNGVYATTGGQPVPGANQTSFAGIAREAGYAHSYEFSDLEEFATQAEQILKEVRPVLVSIKTVPKNRTREERTVEHGSSRSRRTVTEAMTEVRESLGNTS